MRRRSEELAERQREAGRAQQQRIEERGCCHGGAAARRPREQRWPALDAGELDDARRRAGRDEQGHHAPRGGDCGPRRSGRGDGSGRWPGSARRWRPSAIAWEVGAAGRGRAGGADAGSPGGGPGRGVGAGAGSCPTGGAGGGGPRTADRAREQLREHLAEVHAYARQSRDDLEPPAQQVQAEAERVRQQELALHVARDEHRLAVAAFRQQLIEWQGHGRRDAQAP